MGDIELATAGRHLDGVNGWALEIDLVREDRDSEKGHEHVDEP